ncbi:MAG: hypothetical protein AB7S26_10405 [Sandaracinaceae bacterium]
MAGATSRAFIQGAVALGLAVVPALARADAVGPCPPGFDASHAGCHPEWPAIGGMALCLFFGLMLGAGLVVFLSRKSTKKDGPGKF